MITWRRITSFCLCWHLILLLGLSVSGSERTGSLQITLEHADEPLCGESLTLYQVGTGMDIVLLPPFENYTGLMEADPLAEYVMEQKISGKTMLTDNCGVVFYGQLNSGLYLVVQRRQTEGCAVMCPFLVKVPMEIRGEEIWDVKATPKTDTIKPDIPEDPKLPQTGQQNWQVWTLLSVGMGLLLCGYCLRRKRN